MRFTRTSANSHFSILNTQGPGDRESEGEYVWVDGNESTYRNWMPGQPNNHGGQVLA